MNKSDLRNMLKEQHLPFDEAVQNKLLYLQSDDVFLDDIDDDDDYHNAPVDNDDAFVSAFDLGNGNFNNADNNIATAFNDTSLPSQRVAQTTTNQPAAASKQSLAARIAALRGISFPGDHLPRK